MSERRNGPGQSRAASPAGKIPTTLLTGAVSNPIAGDAVDLMVKTGAAALRQLALKAMREPTWRGRLWKIQKTTGYQPGAQAREELCGW